MTIESKGLKERSNTVLANNKAIMRQSHIISNLHDSKPREMSKNFLKCQVSLDF